MATAGKYDSIIHQTLHGYTDGHRLLASSRKLPREDERVMLVLSDLSGQGLTEGFETYLTGYPLSSAGIYALAHTWYAPEMGRPGCVWTHTLLIDREFFHHIQNLASLLQLFRRPQNAKDFEEYKTPTIFAPPSEMELAPSIEVDNAVVIDVMEALYGNPDQPVVVGIHRSLEVQELFLAIWSQQWPELRASFSFCTGSLSNRNLRGKSFDLQGIPQKDARRFMKTENPPQLVYLHDDKNTSNAHDRTKQQWLNWSDLDLLSAGETPFRSFLWYFSQQLPNERRTFQSLAEIFGVLYPSSLIGHPLQEIVRIVAKKFPRPEEAATLKQALFGLEEHPHLPYIFRTETERLQQIVLSPFASAFDPSNLAIHQRTVRLWQSEPDVATSILSELSSLTQELQTPMEEAFIQGTVEAIFSDAVSLPNTSKFGVLEALVSFSPASATHPKVWSVPIEVQLRLFDILADRKNNLTAILPSIVSAALTAGTDEISSKFARCFGRPIVSYILDWFNQITLPQRRLFNGWKNVLLYHPDSAMDWLEANEDVRSQTVALLTTVLRPGSGTVRKHGIVPWMKHPPHVEDLSSEDFVHTMTFYLAMAIEQRNSTSFPAVQLSFDTVYQAARQETFRPESWSLLTDCLPSNSWWRDWDRCERLRRGAVDGFLRYGWPMDGFPKITANHRTLQDIINEFSDRREGRQFLRSLRKDVMNGKIEAPQGLVKMLEDFIYK